MDASTAATLLMIFAMPDGTERVTSYGQPSVAECEVSAAKMLANPKHKTADYTVRHECLPHYRDDTLILGE